MATIKTARILSDWKVQETMDDAPATGTNSISSQAFNPGVASLSPAGSPPAEKYAAWEPQIPTSSSGTLTLTIDMIDLPGTENNVDGTGLKVRRIRLQNPSTNEAAVTIGPAVADGYHLFGADVAIEVPVGGSLEMSFGEGAPVVGSWSGANNRYLELTGEDGDQYRLEIILG